MGKYRILLVLFSFGVIYLDLYINKQNSSFIVSLNVFFAMLLYDYEKLGKNSKGAYDRIVSKMGSSFFAFLVFSFLFLLVISLNGQLKFMESETNILKIDVVFFSFNPFSLTAPLICLFLGVFAITLLEVFSEKEKSKGNETKTVTS